MAQIPPTILLEKQPPVPCQSSPLPSKILKTAASLDSVMRTLSIVPSTVNEGGLIAVEVVPSPLRPASSQLTRTTEAAVAVCAPDAPRELHVHRVDFNPAQQLELKLINSLDVASGAPPISQLSLRDCELSPNFMTRMYSILSSFPSLTRLDISHCYIERATARLLPVVAASLPNLTVFSACHTSMNDACSSHMRALLIACPRITALNLDNNNMTSFGEDCMCDALTQVNSPASGSITCYHLSSRLFVRVIAVNSPSHQLITLTDRSLSRGLSALQRNLFIDVDLRHSSLSPAAAAEIILSIPCFPLLRHFRMSTPDFDACLAVGILLAFLRQPASASFTWYIFIFASIIPSSSHDMFRNSIQPNGAAHSDKNHAPEESWLHRGSTVALSKGQIGSDAPWSSLVVHSTATNLKNTAPCLVQDLCSNFPSVLFETCGRRSCRWISVGYCSLTPPFFRALLTSQSSLVCLRSLILLDCILDALPELLSSVVTALVGLPSLRHVICGGALWSLINDANAVSEILVGINSRFSSTSAVTVLNLSWYVQSLASHRSSASCDALFFRLPTSHVVLSMDPAQMAFLSSLSTFAAQDWSYPTSTQCFSAFERAAAAVECRLNATAPPNQPALPADRTSDADAGLGSTRSCFNECMVHQAEVSLIQELAPARVTIGAAVFSFISEMQLLTTLCLPNCIPAEVATAVKTLNGSESLSFNICVSSKANSHTFFCSNRSLVQPHRPQLGPQPCVSARRMRCLCPRVVPGRALLHTATVSVRQLPRSLLL
jgi:hypothetical protein